MPRNAPSARPRASATLKRRRASVMTIASSTHRIGTHDPAAMPPAELPPLTPIGASRYPVSLNQRVPGSSPGASSLQVFVGNSEIASAGRRPLPRRFACRSSRLVLSRAFRLTPRRRRLAKKAMSGGSKMKRSAAIRSGVLLAAPSIVLLGVLAAGSASAQQAVPDDGLTATHKLGRQVFAQSCGICHLPPQINARTYGPLLSNDTAGGNG